MGYQSVSFLANQVFKETNIYKLFVMIVIGNRASRKIVEKIGFKQEGLLKKQFLIEGKTVDECGLWYFS